MTNPAFRLNGTTVDLTASDPTESLLRWLNRRASHGTKEGCADGDCGACTIALIESGAGGQRRFRAVNSCLLPVGSVSGRDIVTVEHLADADDLHPVQQAMVECSGSQCGYCTPGFVMSLFAGFSNGELDDHTTEGNLCRCTGYAPIRRATDQLRSCKSGSDRFSSMLTAPALDIAEVIGGRYFQPLTLAAAIDLKRRHSHAHWIAGATDLGVELSRGRRRDETFIALDRIDELKHIKIDSDGVTIGAGVALSAVESELGTTIPALGEMLRWFAARQVKNRATFGGNLGTASPIGDLLPILLALDGEIHLHGSRGARVVAAQDFFIDYRKTARSDDELIVAVRLPLSPHRSATYKVAKRQSDDISIVAAVFAMSLDEDRRVQHVRLAYGGVAAIPKRASATEGWLLGRTLDAPTIEQAARLLAGEFTPMSDHRASADYRRALVVNLFARFVAEHFA
ncbi:MAG: FAD binding domain-containing protein [Xanthomonadales bacterium]|nr:FAD binding domain-containing protein [Xanthomonadales bacterium]